LDNKYFIEYPESEISKIAADLISQKYELSKRFKKKEVFLETEEMKLKTIVPEMILTYKSKRINLMIKEVQREILSIQKEDSFEKLTELQQQMVLLHNLRNEISKNLRDRVII
jgi:DNA primase